MEKVPKKIYSAPRIERMFIELEQGIAAGSALVEPEDMNDHVSEQWQVDDTEDRTINWDLIP